MSFEQAFQSLTAQEPFPWQKALYEEFLYAPPFRPACDLPTGLGKTSIIVIWLLALAHRAGAGTLAGFPRRLVYVVNRRTVVDQSTEIANKLRAALDMAELAEVRENLASLAARTTGFDGRPMTPLAISTLRGEFADNAEWREDPARAAIIIGTVDMIGSRMLFAGYGPGFKSRPLHAGFLGQDVLLVHDEAHLEPAFQELLERIISEQERCRDFRRLRVMALTATSRDGGSVHAPLLSNADHANPIVSRRLNARKIINFHATDEESVATKIAECALAYKNSKRAILIFVQKLEDVEAVAEKLGKEGCQDNVQRLTGTMRGRERDKLVTENRVFARFRPDSGASPQEDAVYLICTSAGEVGIDISAAHLVCDLTPFDSMAQRFGRVNRFGNGDASIDIIYANSANNAGKSKKNPGRENYEAARVRTLELLQSLNEHNASPAALMQLRAADRLAAFTPKPAILPATDILFDAWALTTVRKLPGRPPVDDWLHGIAEWEAPETRVAWRDEVGLIKEEELLKRYPPEELLEDYPLKPHELLRDRYDRVFAELKAIADRDPQLPVWIVESPGIVTVTTVNALIVKGKEVFSNKTLILPPAAGGLGFRADNQPIGLLDGKTQFIESARDHYDIADEWRDTNQRRDTNQIRRRCRLWDNAEPPDQLMRLIRPPIDTWSNDEEREAEQEPGPRYWYWYVRPRSADDDGSRTARERQDLLPHLRCAGDFASAIVTKLGLPEPEATAIRLAARWHDLAGC